MITVAILINGQPIYSRTAVNISKRRSKRGICLYKLDTGKAIPHNPDEGAITLAVRMLESIHEVK